MRSCSTCSTWTVSKLIPAPLCPDGTIMGACTAPKGPSTGQITRGSDRCSAHATRAAKSPETPAHASTPFEPKAWTGGWQTVVWVSRPGGTFSIVSNPMKAGDVATIDSFYLD